MWLKLEHKSIGSSVPKPSVAWSRSGSGGPRPRRREAVVTDDKDKPPPPGVSNAGLRLLDEYRAKQDAQRAKMARLTALRLKAEAKSGMKPKKR